LDLLDIERRVTRIGEWQPAMIPGFLQTAAYAGHVLRLACGPSSWGADDAEIDRMVAARIRRQEQALYTKGKQIQAVVLEAALRIRLVPPDVLAGQLDRLVAVAGLPTVELGVIPADVPVPIYPISSFLIYDRELVLVETLVDEYPVTSPDDIASYDRFFADLMAAAARGDQAVPIIQRALDDLRGVR
jgi:Domain of unknown function (DUF5753)